MSVPGPGPAPGCSLTRELTVKLSVMRLPSLLLGAEQTGDGSERLQNEQMPPALVDGDRGHD